MTPTPGPSTVPGGVFFDTSLFLRLRFPTKGTPAISTHTQSPAVSSLPPATTPTECADDPKPREVQPLALGHSEVQLALECQAHLTHPLHELTLENIPESMLRLGEPLGTAGVTG